MLGEWTIAQVTFRLSRERRTPLGSLAVDTLDARNPQVTEEAIKEAMEKAILDRMSTVSALKPPRILVVGKIMLVFGYPLWYGPEHLGCPKGDLNSVNILRSNGRARGRFHSKGKAIRLGLF